MASELLSRLAAEPPNAAQFRSFLPGGQSGCKCRRHKNVADSWDI